MRLVAAPLRPHLHLQLEEDRVAEQVLDLRPRARADLPAPSSRPCRRGSASATRSRRRRRADDLLVDLLDLDRDRVRHLLARQLERLLADELGDLRLDARGRCAGRAGSTRGPSGSSPTSSSRSSSIPSPVFALTGWSAWKSPSFDGGLHLRRDVARLEAVDLVQRDHDRHAEREDALGDEAVAGADPLARVERRSSTASTSSNAGSTVRCMRSVSGSSGRWKPGRSTSTSW